jgi:hypothetical protein
MLCIAFTYFVSADILFIFSSLLFGIACDFDNFFTYKELFTVHLQKYIVAGFHFSCLLFLVLFRFFALFSFVFAGFHFDRYCGDLLMFGCVPAHAQR